MARPTKLAPDDVQARLRSLPGWELKDGKLHRMFSFKDFVQAFAFMTDMAQEAEALGHHPDWCNVYNRVTIDLVTHDAQGVTALDFELAHKAQSLAGRRQ
ncbi:MAG TPA: 4a-hydroxytetrahydrobiopterin dehydratase [Candidatus Methylomirabilis sp.]|nr:4a-hydroxytetrahydrobiopterin dehydratase [Candidatus Methylomirabilis sp.]